MTTLRSLILAARTCQTFLRPVDLQGTPSSEAEFNLFTNGNSLVIN